MPSPYDTQELPMINPLEGQPQMDGADISGMPGIPDPMMQPQPMEDDETEMSIEDLITMAGTNPELLTPEEQARLADDEQTKIAAKHYDNLAKTLEQSKLNSIAEDIIELVEEDDQSRKDWFLRVQRGIRNLGVSDKTLGGAAFKGASTVVHPVLMEACTQFQARAIQEMWPTGGPVKTQVLGTKTPDKMNQADRVESYMNYLYTVEMTEAFTEEDNMLLRLPLSGSTFKKMFFDPLKRRLSSIFVEPADFIVSYSTVDLHTSPRYTHRVREYVNDVRKKEKTGYYIKSDKIEDFNEDSDRPSILDEIDDTEGKERTNYETDDDRATMYEVYIDYDLKLESTVTTDDVSSVRNYPSKGDQDATMAIDSQGSSHDKEGEAHPYIITIDRDSRTIKRIQRNWKPNDELQTKRMYFTHYRFTPGLGFYGYGFLHLIGGLAAAATGLLRALMDSAGFSNMQGGYKTRDSRLPGGNVPLAPGEWREVNSTADELRKAFFPVPYKEPSETMYRLLGYIDEKARHLAGITEINTGETNAKDSPVGTTAMLLEQGTKVFTAIHKRIHEAHKQEFKIMAELIEEYMPDEGYPYLLGESEGTLMPEDFDDHIDVIPVSDPNISSNAQRVAKAQSVLELQQQYPNIVRERPAVRRMLEAIQTYDIDELIGNEEEITKLEKEEAQKRSEMEQMEKDRMQIETDKLSAQMEFERAKGVREQLEAMMKAMEAAALVTKAPAIVDLADDLMKSAGFVDADEEGIISQENIPQDPMAPEDELNMDPANMEGMTPEEMLQMPPPAEPEPYPIDSDQAPDNMEPSTVEPYLI